MPGSPSQLPSLILEIMNVSWALKELGFS